MCCYKSRVLMKVNKQLIPEPRHEKGHFRPESHTFCIGVRLVLHFHLYNGLLSRVCPLGFQNDLSCAILLSSRNVNNTQ